ncbi:MAG: hypothetical protein Q4G27_09100 [Flavobacteriaceae bacterium]|nr:hypothetical protein [Flavobacteriaceae bacterium]
MFFRIYFENTVYTIKSSFIQYLVPFIQFLSFGCNGLDIFAVELKTRIMQTETSTTTKSSMAVIAYITIIGLIIAYITNQEKRDLFTQYHIRQSLGLAVTGLALGVIGLIPILGWIISIFGTLGLIVLWITGLMNAINYKKQPVALLGKKYEEWFKNL